MRCVTTKAQVITFLQPATFKNFKLFGTDFLSVSLKALSVIWNKPTLVGATIKELSKLSFYGFHHQEMPPCYGSDRLKVVDRDTDSLFYRI